MSCGELGDAIVEPIVVNSSADNNFIIGKRCCGANDVGVDPPVAVLVEQFIPEPVAELGELVWRESNEVEKFLMRNDVHCRGDPHAARDIELAVGEQGQLVTKIRKALQAAPLPEIEGRAIVEAE